MAHEEWQSEEDAHELGRWFDGELPEKDRAGADAEMRRRLADDPDLANSVEFLQAVRDVVRGRERISVSPGFASRVSGAVFGAGGESPWVVAGPFIRTLAMAASVLLVLSLGLGAWHRSAGRAETSPEERLARVMEEPIFTEMPIGLR